MLESLKTLPEGKQIFFASDFHLGAPNAERSREREFKIISWIRQIEDSAAAIVLAGDIFDFWFEYRHAVPKGFVRLLGKLGELTDRGIPVVLFTGNHDMWMFNYLKDEIGAVIFKTPQLLETNGKRILVGHGDGLGNGDFSYKILKSIFANKMCQWAFARLHPNLGIGIARRWSRYSRNQNGEIPKAIPQDKDFLFEYCKSIEQSSHHDYYIFGHRHRAEEKNINESSVYVNLGDWLNHSPYAAFDGKEVRLFSFQEQSV